MALALYNTLGREKQAFEPIDPKNVRMYVCGPTVYDLAHIGNARPVVVFDVLYRLLRHHYGKDHVKYVRNITDVDDKIIAASKETGEPIDRLTARTEKAFHEDMAALGALDPDEEPRATQHIPEMIKLIECLLGNHHAYAAQDHLLFNTQSMAEYGRLSRHNRDELVAGARVEVAPYKRDPADFVLWKPSTDDQPGWDSPWGRGRPGWHLECSAMSEKHLGVPFDIHGGGQDLIFPHHENEIAQSTCAHGDGGFVNYWVHNGYLLVEGEKMSKSLGNIITVRDLLEQAPGEAIRYNLLGTHYRQPADWTKAGLMSARKIMDGFYHALRKVADINAKPAEDLPAEIREALEDDLNTPAVRGPLRQIARGLNKATSIREKSRLKGELLAAGNFLGLFQEDPEKWFKGISGYGAQTLQPLTQRGTNIETTGYGAQTLPSLSQRGSGTETTGHAAQTLPSLRQRGSGSVPLFDDEIDTLIKERAEARKTKDFAEADRIRDELKKKGVVLEDKPDGTTDWRNMG